MKLTANFKSIVTEIIVLLYVLLFVYAAVSKLLDFENFQVQLGQSPLLSAFAGWLSWLVPISELFIAGLLLVRRTRLYGLYLSFLLMVFFTTYIFTILNYSESIPCSCGGILERMDWNEHLWFNVFFVALSVLGLFFMPFDLKFRKTVLILISLALISIVSFVVLYKISLRITQYQNTFIRNFPMASRKLSEVDLGYNSYYFAGASEGKVYLGNYTAPLEILVLENDGLGKKHFRISLDETDLPFKSVQVRVNPPYFYAFDGTVSCLYTGRISDWNGRLQYKGDLFVDQVVCVDSTRFIFREQKAKGSIIGKLDLEKKGAVTYNTTILEKQVDGVFDVDGQLLFDKTSKEGVYIYSYRNQYTGIDTDLNVLYRGQTIDTISQAKIKIATVQNRGQRKMSEPALVVTTSAASYGGLLFAHSGILGRFEPEEMWSVASIVDIYRLSDRSYITSIYVHDMERKKMNSFVVEGNRLYAIAGTKLALYELDGLITSKYK
ncbi:DoxX family protein [Flavobacterium tegetincola]|uniref:DoxX family protein n=1 Tax=Flavobacterium tegetincola TaxID=150172 RepID=UPI0004237FD9|nr:DoxX family protein [Flavobacterium tegetincola]